MEFEEILYAQYRDVVKSGWIDINGHMNVAYYVLAFDAASDAFLREVDFDESYIKSENDSFFIVEMNVSYKQELHLGDPLSFTSQLIGVSDKKIHLYHRMYHETEGYLAATNEILLLHIDMDTRRSSFIPQAMRSKLKAIIDKQASIPPPDNLSRVFNV